MVSVTVRSALSVRTPSDTCAVTSYTPSASASSGASKSLAAAKERAPAVVILNLDLSSPPEIDHVRSDACVSSSVAFRVATVFAPSATVNDEPLVISGVPGILTVTVTESSAYSPSSSVTRNVKLSIASALGPVGTVNVGDATAAADRVTDAVPV